jgi:MOSC domain-containing protein YiiM
VTLINALFVQGSGFEYVETRRNIATLGVELMDLIGQEFAVGDAMMRGLEYCYPCLRPSVLSNKNIAFRDAFHDRGGLVAEVLKSGLIRVGSPVIPPKKHYG